MDIDTKNTRADFDELADMISAVIKATRHEADALHLNRADSVRLYGKTLPEMIQETDRKSRAMWDRLYTMKFREPWTPTV